MEITLSHKERQAALRLCDRAPTGAVYVGPVAYGATRERFAYRDVTSGGIGRDQLAYEAHRATRPG